MSDPASPPGTTSRSSDAQAWLLKDGRVLAALEITPTGRQRRRGLLGRDRFDGALLLRPCRHVHTVGMRFPLDVAFCDDNGRVLRTLTLKPWRTCRPCLRAAFAVEAQAPAFERWGLQVGDRVEIRE